MSNNVLVTSISRKVPLLKLVRSAMRRIDSGARLFGGDSDHSCIGRHFVDEFWRMQLVPELTCDRLTTYCLSRGITRIIPTRDEELAFFAECREILAGQGIQTMVSRPEGIEVCRDKRRFVVELDALGFPVVPLLESPEEVQSGVLVVKERFGAGACGVGLALTPDAAEKWASSMQDPIFQPYVEGQEFSIDVYVDRQGRAKGAIARSRDLVKAGESQITTTCWNHELTELSARLAESLGLYGHVVFQGILAEDGFYFIECNARFGGASTLSVQAGLDSFYWFLCECAGEDLSRQDFVPSDLPLRQVRYPEDLIFSA
jgi:carbamoyl-phosphate synthase large subunit